MTGPGSEVEPELRVAPLGRELTERWADDLLALGSDLDWDYWTREHLLADRPEKWERSLLALRDEKPVGYAIVSRKDTAAHLHHLVVAERARGAGIGARLTDELRAAACRDGLERVTLKVLRDSTAAQRFYLRLGFEHVAEEGDYDVLASGC